MKAYHNDSILKDILVARADHNGGRHGFLAEQLGVPTCITQLHDMIFAGLPRPERQFWSGRLLLAIPVGADLNLVAPRFLSKILDRLTALDNDASGLIALIKGTQGVLRDRTNLGTTEWAEAAAEAARAPWSTRKEWAVREAAWAVWAAARVIVCTAAENAARAMWLGGRTRTQTAAWMRIADDLVEAISEVASEA